MKIRYKAEKITFQITSVEPLSVAYYQPEGEKWLPVEGHFNLKIEDIIRCIKAPDISVIRRRLHYSFVDI